MPRLHRIASNEFTTLHGADIDIAGITADSRQVRAGFLFIAIPGTKHDGTTYIAEAVKAGATAVLVPENTPTPSGVTRLTSTDIRRSVSAIAAAFYARQPECIVAVTGTSGKTSTAQFTREIWQAMGQPSASIGTLGLVTATEERYGSLTTPDAITLHQLLDECAARSINHVVMEASSHGLSLHRLDNVKLAAAGFTNLSRDHLDYHGTMEEYRAAKLRLFSTVLPSGAMAVLNADSPEYAFFAETAQKHGLQILDYGTKAKSIKLIETVPDAKGQVLKIELLGRRHEIPLPLIGGFQAWNGLCALGLVIGAGGNAEAAAAGLAKVTGVPGRLQLAGATGQGGAVFVDYAHKPDALENVLKALRPHVEAHPGAKLGVVFGCGGNRDKGKRPIMGEIATRLADWVIVTDDNPRHEEPATIRQEILAGCTGGAPYADMGDRAEAIRSGIGKMGRGDVLIIAGKGHEHGQIVGDQTLPFDDAEVARKVLGL